MRRTFSQVVPRRGPWWVRSLARVAVLSFAGTCASGLVALLALASSEAKHEQVKTELAGVAVDLESYRVCHGDWPETLADVYGQTPVDPWGRPYVFAPPTGRRVAPDVLGLGADGWPGGAGVSADVWMSEVRHPDAAYENFPPGC